MILITLNIGVSDCGGILFLDLDKGKPNSMLPPKTNK